MKIVALGVALLAGLCCHDAKATIYYTVSEGAGTSGAVDLSFQTAAQIPRTGPGIAATNVTGPYAIDFMGMVKYLSGNGIYFVAGQGNDTINQLSPTVDLTLPGQYSVSLAANNMLVGANDTLLVSNTPLSSNIPAPGSLALLAPALAALGAPRAPSWVRGLRLRAA